MCRRTRAGVVALSGLAWLACTSACQLAEDPPQGAYAYRGNYLIGIPAPEEGLRMDVPFQVRWDSKAVGNPGRVDVFLQSDLGELPLVRNLPDTGGFLADLRGMRLPAINDFRIKVIDADHPERMDFSNVFSILPAFQFRLYFREPAAGAILNLDSTYAFSLELPQFPVPKLDIQLLRGEEVVAELPGSVSGSELSLRLSGRDVGSGTGFRFRLLGNPWSVVPQYIGISEPFTITSEYSGGGVFPRTGSPDTVAAGSVDTLVYAKQGNPGFIEVTGLYSDTAFLRPLTLIDAFYSGDTARVLWRVPEGLTTDSRYRIGVQSVSDPNLPISFSEPFTILGVERDAFENDNDPGSAKELRLGDPFQIRTLPDMDTDWAWFDVTAGEYYAIRLGGINRYGITVTQDSIEVPLKALTSGFQPDLSIFIVRPEKSGRCRVKIESFWPSQDAVDFSYNISLYNGNLDFSGVKLGFSSPAAGATVPTGGAFPVRWTPDTILFESTVRIDLYRDSVLVQTLAEAAPNSGTFDWSVDAWLERSPAYRIRIRRRSDITIFGQSQPFAIDGVPRDAYEPDDIRSLAKRIETGALAQARTLLRSDTDWVAFACSPGTRYRVAVTSGFPLILNVFDGLKHTAGGVNPSLSGVKGNGDCAIQVVPYQSHVGEYGVSVSPEQ